VRASDVEVLGRIRSVSGLGDVPPAAFVARLAAACFPNAPPPASPEGLQLPAAARHNPALAIVSMDAFRSALTTLIPAGRLQGDADSAQFLSVAFMRLFYLFAEYARFMEQQEQQQPGGGGAGSGSAGAGGVPFCDLACGLLFVTAGSKTEKLLAAFAACAPEAAGGGGGALSPAQFAGLLRSLLVGLLSFRSQQHHARQTEAEARTLDALVDVSADIARAVFREACGGAGAAAPGARLGFADFGRFYNVGGYAVVPWLELLDFKKARRSDLVGEQ
jgi:hypothetical protein